MFVYTDTVCGFMIVTSDIMGFCIKKKTQPFIFDIVDFFFNYDERIIWEFYLKKQIQNEYSIFRRFFFRGNKCVFYPQYIRP